MKTTKLRAAVVALASATVLAAGTSYAAPVIESGDAGELTSTAQTTAGSGSIDSIRGSLLTTSGTDYPDLFRIYLRAGTAFTATTTASSIAYNNFDTTLFLFDSTGRGVVANDDDPSFGPTSTINFTASIADYYYLAIAGTGYTPVSAGGPIFGSLYGQNQVGPTGSGGASPLTGWISESSEGDLYEIQLRGAFAGAAAAAVPEPGSMLLAALGLGAIGVSRRRNARSAA